jgi:AraC-like DNA-binding protein
MTDDATAADSECDKSIPSPMCSATARVDIWSTDAICARERFSYWRDAVCRALFNISVEAPPERFSARITGRTCGEIRLATSESTGYQLVRSRRDIAGAHADHYTVYLQGSGRTVITQNDDTTAFEPNDVGIFDGREPFRADLTGRRSIVVLPRAMIDRRAPWLRRSPLRRLTRDSPFVDLARRHLLALSDDDAILSESQMSLLADSLCNLLALASATDMSPRRLQGELQTEALLAFCRQHLHDPELSPQRAADYLGVPIRTLHARFRQVGQSFGRFVLENRLDACRTALRDENQRSLNISEIAYRWGFNDLSHFNRAFRARFDMTPREWRNGMEAEPRHEAA